MKPILLMLLVVIAGCAVRPASPSAKDAAAVPPARHQTGRDLDLAIDGDGYFIVQTDAGGYLFTRDGGFAVAANGLVVNDDGYALFPQIKVTPGAASLSIASDGVVRLKSAAGQDDIAGQIVLCRFVKASALEQDGPYRMPTPASGDPISGKPGSKGLGNLVIGELEN